MVAEEGEYVALVTGASGLVGRHIVQNLASRAADEGWRVFAMTRHEEDLNFDEANMSMVGCIEVPTLTDAVAVHTALSDVPQVTHLFHCAARAEDALPRAAAADSGDNDPIKEVKDNLAMLVNVVEALEAGPSTETLMHVYVQSGFQYYGAHLGEYKTPAKEDDARALAPHYYYALEDYLRYRTNDGALWTWSALRAAPVVGYSPTSHMNLLNAVGVYAAITQRLGLPFRFPGSKAAYNAIRECVDARLLADAAVFTAIEAPSQGKAFNVNNGDVFRWSELWPRLADHFGLETAPPQKLRLAKMMSTGEKKYAWRSLVKDYQLLHGDLGQLVSWEYADLMLSGMEWDFCSSTVHLQQAGYDGQCLDSADVWIEHLQFLVEIGVLPPLGKVPQQQQADGMPQYKALAVAGDAPEGAPWFRAIYDSLCQQNAF